MANKTVLTGEWKDGKLQGFGTRTTIFEAEQAHHWSEIERERESVCVCEGERECVCVRERDRDSVSEREAARAREGRDVR